MSKILITAFEAFNEQLTNSSLEILNLLKDRYLDKIIIKKILPVSYTKVPNELKEYIENEKPDKVLLLGQAGGETRIRIEKIAINFIKAQIPDNDGLFLNDILIDDFGNMAYFATLNVSDLVRGVEEEGVPCYLSLSAGGYLCNYTMYNLLKLLDGTFIQAGFVHLPFYDGQQDIYPSMKKEDILKAVEKIINML